MSQTPVIIAVSVVWLAIGSAIGGYLFPDQVTVEKRVEVPVEVLKYVDRPVEIIKEVVKIKEVEKPVEVVKTLEKRVPSPVFIPWPGRETVLQPAALAWTKLEKEMTKNQVLALLGKPLKETPPSPSDGAYYMFYDLEGKVPAYVLMRDGAFNDTVAEWVAPSETISHPDYLSELLKLCENAEEAGDLPLALYYAKAALQISGGSPRFSNIVKNLESRIPATHK
jgi:hypothetical protein